MSTGKIEPPTQSWTVRLTVREVGFWFSVTCDTCGKIVIAGDGEVMGVKVRDAVERAAGAHMHQIG